MNLERNNANSYSCDGLFYFQVQLYFPTVRLTHRKHLQHDLQNFEDLSRGPALKRFVSGPKNLFKFSFKCWGRPENLYHAL
jgi:hypothetical protein